MTNYVTTSINKIIERKINLTKRFSVVAIITALVLSLVFVPVDFASAQIADGTYDVSYEMKEAGNNNTSIADGYFQKPAKVTVSGGTATVQFTVTSANMVKSLSTAGGMSVVSESGDTRTYKFQTNDLSQPISMSMNIVVPKGTPGLEAGYDRNHTARAVFNVGNLPQAGSNESGDGEKSGEATNSGNTDKAVDNPKTSDDSPILMYTILLIGAAGAFVLVRKLRPANE